jgi:hypothetical protein
VESKIVLRSGRAPFIAMVQIADLRKAHDTSPLGRLHRSWFGCILVQSQVATTVMVIIEKRSEMARQAGLVENDHVIQALSANGADHAFGISPLPRRAWGRQLWFPYIPICLIDWGLSVFLRFSLSNLSSAVFVSVFAFFRSRATLQLEMLACAIHSAFCSAR